MLRIFRRSLGALLSIGFMSASLAVPATAQDLAGAIDAAIAPYFKAGEPGATFIVVKDGKTVFRKGYGLANVEKGTALEPQMMFRLGSVTKQFTAVSILMLAEQGKLAVSDDITKYLPDYPTRGKKITIENLLTHTSGIRGYTDLPKFGSIMQTDMTVAQMIDFFKDEPLQFEPGERYTYSNSGYFLLGAVIEKVSGMSYAEFVAKNIFEPLGMKNTSYEGHERNGGKRVEGYARGKDGFELARPISMTQPYAAGALISNVDDMAIWDAAITAGKLLKPESWKKAFTPFKLNNGQLSNYGYGWNLRKLRGHDVIDHGGGINGFVTHSLRLPQDKVYVAVLMNGIGREAGPNYYADKIAAIAIGNPFPEYKAIKLDSKILDRYEGTYKVDEKSSRIVSRVGDQLFVQRMGGPKIGLQAYSETEFFIPNTSFARYKFVRNDQGIVTHLLFYGNDDKEETNIRTGDKPAGKKSISLAPGVFDAYVGEYELAPGFVLSVTRDGDRFLTQATGQRPLEIFAETETRFFTKVIEVQLDFVKDADGKVTQVILLQNGRQTPGRKIK